MPVHLTPFDFFLRVAAATACAAAIGLNRGHRGRPAGLRTTILVTLAAAFSMLLVNALLDSAGRPKDSFIQNDLMRLPLGILTGVGFLGTGVIMRKGRAVVGLTTAATLWFVTVMGLCFGAGVYLQGFTAFAIGMAVLWGLKHVETRMETDRRGSVMFTISGAWEDESELHSIFTHHGYRIVASGVNVEMSPRKARFTFELLWRATGHEPASPVFLDRLLQHPGVTAVEWAPQALVEQSEDVG